ncbi:MAG: hypothetical protein CL726_01665 [Chloroflexi bacterium]|nr:hypothetical protein [Chloroflexota bacterium]
MRIFGRFRFWLAENCGVDVEQWHGPFAAGPVKNDFGFQKFLAESAGIDAFVEDQFKDVRPVFEFSDRHFF